MTFVERSADVQIAHLVVESIARELGLAMSVSRLPPIHYGGQGQRRGTFGGGGGLWIESPAIIIRYQNPKSITHVTDPKPLLPKQIPDLSTTVSIFCH